MGYKDIQSKNQKMHYKDVLPTETITRINEILDKMSLSLKEEWYNLDGVGTPSLRVTFKGTDVGQNGKGINIDYARASAYAELIERYSTGIIHTLRTDIDTEFKFLIDKDEKWLSAEELIMQKDPYLNRYFEKRLMKNKSLEEKAKHFKEINTIDYMISGKENTYLSLPFYDVTMDKLYYLPYNLILFNYGSNGMSSGNTPAEAIVQGLSEIFERHVQCQILTKNVSLSTVPDSYIKKFPYIYDIYKDLQKMDGYTILMKDCSLGGKYPVAGLLIIQNNTGKYGLKLGCHPDFGVAMERTITEAAQGRSILEYSQMSELDFFNNFVDSDFNIENSYSVGKAQYPVEIFSDNSSENFVEVRDVSSKNNEILLQEWLKNILEDGHEVLVRDYSVLGFPTYHIIIPGLSETVDLNDSRIRINNTRTYLISKLQDIESLDNNDLELLITILIQSSKFIIMNEVRNLFPLLNSKLPFEEFTIACGVYLAAQCCVQLGRLDRAVEFISQAKRNILKIVDETDEKQKELANRIRAEFFYLTAFLRFGNHKEVIGYMNQFFDSNYCEFVDELYSDHKKVLSKQYSQSENRSDDSAIREIMEKRKQSLLDNNINQCTIGKYLKGLIDS